MRIGGVVLTVILSVSLLTPARAAMRISEDRGGQIGHYMRTFAMLRSTGERVIIDGNCLSACTLVLGMIPRQRMCATSRARLGFHAAWIPDADGRPVTSTLGTRALWNAYPRAVRHWIAHHGGLSRHMIYMRGRELYRFIPNCKAVARRQRHNTHSRHVARSRQHAHSRHRNASRRVRYYSASAANDRR